MKAENAQVRTLPLPFPRPFPFPSFPALSASVHPHIIVRYFLDVFLIKCHEGVASYINSIQSSSQYYTLISTPQEFAWLSQLKHRWDDKMNRCFVDICDACFIYSNEYLGNTARLVITPLTDRYSFTGVPVQIHGSTEIFGNFDLVHEYFQEMFVSNYKD